MAIITGTTVNWVVSPRIIVIPDTVNSITIDDLQDTLQDLEDNEEGMVWPYLRKMSGGEDLGGGTSVGYTMELQNAQVQFQGRTSATESGAVSADDSTGTLLYASGGQFVTNGVSRGDTVFNNVTGGMATILSVTDEQNLISQVLSGGSRATWLNTDTYSIYVNVQCSILGGNLVAVDSGGSSISPVLQSPNTNVIRTSSSSATLQNQEQLQAASYAGKEGLTICIDPLNASGRALDKIEFPAGTREQPCLTEANFDTIHAARGIRNATVISSITLTESHSQGHIFFGDNPQTVVITLDSSCSMPGCKFQDCYVQGQFTSGNIIWECIVGSITNANGFIYQSTIVGPIVVGGNLSMERCWTATVGTNNVIDFNSTPNSVGITCWNGGTIEVKNMVAGCIFGMGGTAGSVYFDPATCTGGAANIGGAIRLKNQTVDEVEALGLSFNNATVASQVRTELSTELALISDADTIAATILTEAQTTPVHADARMIRGQTITGSGTEADPWGPA